MKASARRFLGFSLGVLLAAPLLAQSNARDLNEPQSAVGLSYEYEDFDQEGFDPWRMLSLDLSHRFGFGSVIGRVNQADRFGESARQYELDAYPRLRKGTYAYLNVGRAEDDESFFPDWRYGAEIYQSLPGSFEFSLGGRHLDFGTSDVTLYTGSLGRYWGNNWISFRPYVSNRDDGTSVSGGVQYRHYFATPDDYIGFGASYGEAPEEDVVREEIDRLQSASFRVNGKHKLPGTTFILTGSAGWRELEFRLDRTRSSWFASAGVQKRF